MRKQTTPHIKYINDINGHLSIDLLKARHPKDRFSWSVQGGEVEIYSVRRKIVGSIRHRQRRQMLPRRLLDIHLERWVSKFYLKVKRFLTFFPASK